MSGSSSFRRDSHAGTVHLPAGAWTNVLDALCARFPAIGRGQWLDRIARGRVLDGQGVAIAADSRYREGMRIHYYREVEDETEIPFVETVVHADEHLVVADKPHFLPVTPAGGFVEQTLLRRLIRRLHNPQLVPLHRIDRATAGLVLFSANPASRAAYQALFRERRIAKRYEALAPPLPELAFPLWLHSRIVRGEHRPWRTVLPHVRSRRRTQQRNAHRGDRARHHALALRAAARDRAQAPVARADGGAGRGDHARHQLSRAGRAGGRRLFKAAETAGAGTQFPRSLVGRTAPVPESTEPLKACLSQPTSCPCSDTNRGSRSADNPACAPCTHSAHAGSASDGHPGGTRPE